jgi:hypothetical protein
VAAELTKRLREKLSRCSEAHSARARIGCCKRSSGQKISFNPN